MEQKIVIRILLADDIVDNVYISNGVEADVDIEYFPWTKAAKQIREDPDLHCVY